MRKVYILNGPPGIGKDTIMQQLIKMRPFAHGEFKAILYEHTARFISGVCKAEVTPQMVRERNEDRDLKERPWYKRTSVRRWLQITSECAVKPYAGQDFFGKEAAKLWYGLCCPVVVSDGGFAEEMIPVCETFGPENVIILRLKADGWDFGTDTRRYIEPDEVPCAVRDVQVIRGNVNDTVIRVLAAAGEIA